MTKVAVMPAFLKLLMQHCQMEDVFKSIIECPVPVGCLHKVLLSRRLR